MKVRRIVTTALFAALLCALAPLAVPIGPVPVTLASLAVYLIGAAVPPRPATGAVAVYILLGAAGLPVFSGFSGGLAKLLGPTGGFIFGYLPCAVLISLFSSRFKSRRGLVGGMLCGTAALYLCGTAWYLVWTGTRLGAALMACVVPFLPGDALKMLAAAAIGPVLRRRLEAGALAGAAGRREEDRKVP